MKINSLPQVLATAAIALSVAMLPSLSVSAQTSAPPDVNTTTDTRDAGDRDFDWGWLGLLGLAGLAGLAKKNEAPAVHYRDRDEVTNPSSRY